MSPGFRPVATTLDYDYLVIALGNVTNFYGMPGMMENAMPFRTLADALAVRNHLIHALEEADCEEDADLRQEAADLRGGRRRLLGRRGDGGAERFYPRGEEQLPAACATKKCAACWCNRANAFCRKWRSRWRSSRRSCCASAASKSF